MTPPLRGNPPRSLLGIWQRPGQDDPAAPPEATTITTELIEAVTGGGQYVVRGVITPTVGSVRLSVGQQVQVAWKQGRPVAILAVQARRAQFGEGGLVDAQPTTGVVEELFLASFEGVLDVWFRNDLQVTNLKVRAGLPADPEYVQWGSRGDAFFVRTTGHKYHIFALNRLVDRVIGAAPVVATLVRMDDVPLINPKLCDLVLAQTMSGITVNLRQDDDHLETSHFHFDTEPADGHLFSVNAVTRDRGQIDVALVSLPLSGTLAKTIDLRLAPLLLGPSSVASAAIQEVALDDRRHLIILVVLDLYRTTALPAIDDARIAGPQELLSAMAVFPPPSTPSPPSCVYPTTTVATLWEPAGIGHTGSRAHAGRHALLVDVTAGSVIWRSCLDVTTITAVRRLVQTGAWIGAGHEFSHIDYFGTLPDGFVPAPDVDTRDCKPAELMVANAANATHQNPGGTYVPPATEFTVIDLGRQGDEVILSVVDHAKVPFIPAEATWFSSTPSLVRAIGRQSPGTSGQFRELIRGVLDLNYFPGGMAISPPDVTVNTSERVRYQYTATTFRQDRTYLLSGHYVPRRMTLDQQGGQPSGAPLGVLYLFVTRTGNPVSQAPDTSIGNFELTQSGVQLAVYAVDLSTGDAPVELMPFTPSEPVPIGGIGPARGWPSVAALSANTHRLLWRRRIGLPGIEERDAVVFTSLDTKESKDVVAETNGDYNPFTTAPPAAKAQLIELLRRNLTLFPPDEMYWPEDGRADANIFVLGWDRQTKALTLSASAATAPPPDFALAGLGALKVLPEGIVPKRARGVPTLYGVQDGDVPFVPGPSYQAINDPTNRTLPG